MTTVTDLLTRAREAGVLLYLDDGDLVVEGYAPAELIEALRRHKPEMVEYLGTPTEPCPECGSGSYYRMEPGAPWYCSGCVPESGKPVTYLAVPGDTRRGSYYPLLNKWDHEL